VQTIFKGGLTMPAPAAQNAKYLSCAEIMPGCSFTASAATEEELIKKVTAHAAQQHGLAELTPELAAKVRAAIKDR
jgi:predicted small metal-binding protein